MKNNVVFSSMCKTIFLKWLDQHWYKIFSISQYFNFQFFKRAWGGEVFPPLCTAILGLTGTNSAIKETYLKN